MQDTLWRWSQSSESDVWPHVVRTERVSTSFHLEVTADKGVGALWVFEMLPIGQKPFNTAEAVQNMSRMFSCNFAKSIKCKLL